MEQLEQERLDCLPYGQWHTNDQSIVIFDKQHRPIFSCKGGDGDITLMNGDEWIDGIVEDKTQYFYNETNSPSQEFHTLAKVKKIMADWMMKYRQQKLSQLSLPKQNRK